jgi:hypothetical protein
VNTWKRKREENVIGKRAVPYAWPHVVTVPAHWLSAWLSNGEREETSALYIEA